MSPYPTVDTVSIAHQTRYAVASAASRRPWNERPRNAAAAMRPVSTNTSAVPSGQPRQRLHRRTDEPGARDRHHPGDQDVPGDSPAHRRQPPRRPGAEHGAGDVWVVETGKPKWAVSQRMVAHEVWAAKPCGGSSFATRVPSVLMIRQPPAYVPMRHRRRGAEDHPVGGGRSPASRWPDDDEGERDHAHRLLGVVRPVGEGDEAAGDELEAPEDAVHHARRAAPRMIHSSRS